MRCVSFCDEAGLKERVGNVVVGLVKGRVDRR